MYSTNNCYFCKTKLIDRKSGSYRACENVDCNYKFIVMFFLAGFCVSYVLNGNEFYYSFKSDGSPDIMEIVFEDSRSNVKLQTHIVVNEDNYYKVIDKVNKLQVFQ